MCFILGRALLVVIASFLAIPSAAALDFDREIKKQERGVKVRYQKPPKSLAVFLKMYPQCQRHSGRMKSRCNVAEAKRRYENYRLAWNKMQEKKRLAAQVQTGEMEVSLAPRDPAARSPELR